MQEAAVAVDIALVQIKQVLVELVAVDTQKSVLVTTLEYAMGEQMV